MFLAQSHLRTGISSHAIFRTCCILSFEVISTVFIWCSLLRPRWAAVATFFFSPLLTVELKRYNVKEREYVMWPKDHLAEDKRKIQMPHLSAPAAVSLTDKLLSSSMGPSRLTASLWRNPGMVWLCCTTREMLAHANSRISALGLCN